MNEIWKNIKGYEGLYEVSNWGRVRSLDHYVEHRGRLCLYKGRILKPGPAGHYHYLKVSLSKNGKVKGWLIHHLVAEAFLPKGEGELDHINNIRTDNRAENLQWLTHKLNCKKRNNKDINAKRCKPVCCYYCNGFYVFESERSAERITGVAHNIIHHCLKGLYKQWNGHKWFRYPLQPPKALPYFKLQ